MTNPTRVVRAMTWNVLWRFGDQWRERQPLIRSTIDRQTPDIVGLQEVWGDAAGSQVAELAAHLGLHGAFASPSLPAPPNPPGRSDQAGYEVGVGLLSRWPITDTTEYRLPSGHRPYVVALATTLAHPSGPLHVVTACLDWAAEHAGYRQEQARSLLSVAADSRRDGPLPVFVLGDMNAPPHAPELRLLAEGMEDAWIVAEKREPDSDGVTLSRDNVLASQDSWLIDQRIDYVFIRAGSPKTEVRVESASVIPDRPHALPASDHNAVVVDVAWSHPSAGA